MYSQLKACETLFSSVQYRLATSRLRERGTLVQQYFEKLKIITRSLIYHHLPQSMEHRGVDLDSKQIKTQFYGFNPA